MALIYLSLGSNIERYRRITAALDALTESFGELQLSSVYESVSVGFEGDSFFNLVVGIQSPLMVGRCLKSSRVSKIKTVAIAVGRDSVRVVWILIS